MFKVFNFEFSFFGKGPISPYTDDDDAKKNFLILNFLIKFNILLKPIIFELI